MRNLKTPLVLLLLIVFSFTIVLPATPAYAASLSDILPQLASSTTGTSGGHGIIDVLLGLLLGKVFGNLNGTAAGSTDSKVLGATTGPVPSQSSATGAAIIATAQKYLETPYVWGGTTTSGFDCSGFTQYVMQQNGISLPRTAEEQFASGTPVDKANLKVGDLVFFTTYKPGASHEGIYMGNGQFIHASSASVKVTISSLDEQFYTEHYIGARRYL
jgi:cell wall-associated NlpC family hydrolase